MIITYDGIGANDRVYFTPDQFLRIMREVVANQDWNSMSVEDRTNKLIYRAPNETRNKNLPEEFPLFTLEEWVDYSGARMLNVNADEPMVETFNNNYNNVRR